MDSLIAALSVHSVVGLDTVPIGSLLEDYLN